MKRALVLLFFLFTPILSALDPGIPIDRYCLRTWTVADGLPQSTILKILQTRDGYIWLGTWGGLVRFNGFRFRVFTSDNTPELKNNTIYDLFEDEEGGLWGTTDRGIFRHKNGRFQRFGREDGLLGEKARYFSPADRNSFWVRTDQGFNLIRDRKISETRIPLVTADGPKSFQPLLCLQNQNLVLLASTKGLYCLRNEKLEFFSRENNLDRTEIWTLAKDDRGVIWVAARNGLHRFSEGGWRFFDRRKYPFLQNITKLYPARNGALWLATTKNGIYCYEHGVFIKPPVKIPDSKLYVSFFMEDRQHNIWCGTNTAGLIRLKKNKSESLTQADGIPHFDIWSMFEDREGNLWVGAFRGLACLKNPKIVSITTKDGLSNDRVRSIFQARDGAIWLGMDGGKRDRLHNGTLSHFPILGSYGFLQDRLGNIWLGNDQSKLLCYARGHLRIVRDLSQYQVNIIYTFCEDRKGNLWIGTANGLLCCHNGRIIPYQEVNGKPLGIIQIISEQDDGSIWIASQQGLIRFQDGKFSPVHSDPELAKKWIRVLYRDAQGVYWLGTDFGGLYRLQGEQLTLYSVKDGLFDNHVSAILEDGRGNLWLSCNRGIYRVDKRELNDFAAGIASVIHCINYGRSDGMLDEECNGGFFPSAWKCRDGSMWFPTQQGVAVIHPERLQFNKTPPEVKIEEITVDGHWFLPPLPRQFKAGTQRVEFHYTAFCFSGPEKIRFKYKLENFNRDWIEAGDRRIAYYTNIPPGKYRFRVIACNDEGIWNEKGANWEFYLKPYFYQTLWFRILTGSGLLLLVGIVFVLRIRQLKKRSAHLESLVAQRTIELKEINNLLSEKIGNIRDSIQYARQIQQALFPKRQGAVIPGLEYFLLFESKETVSGDFYWFFSEKGVLLAAVADCTGHGVPGAMLSVAGYMLLNQVVGHEGLREPGAILERIDQLFSRLFQSRSDEECFYDGMDIILVRIEPENSLLSFAGAGRAVYLVIDGGLQEIRGNPSAIGMPGRAEPYYSRTMDLSANDMIYLSSDGFSSQLNARGIKFGSRMLKIQLTEISGLPLNEQAQHLQNSLQEYKGETLQTDDITLIGIRFLSAYGSPSMK